MMAQQSTIPDRLVVAEFLGGPHHVFGQGLDLHFRQTHWPPRAHFLAQPRQAILSEQLDPVVDATRCIPEQFRNVVGTPPINGQQNSVKSVVVSRFVTATDLFAQDFLRPLWFLELDSSHSHCLHVLVMNCNGMVH